MGANGPPVPSTGGYPPFYGPPMPQPPAPAPRNNNPPAPKGIQPFDFNGGSYVLKDKKRPQHQHQRNQTIPAAPAAAPLKSAMKKTMTVFNTHTAETSLGRQFSNPFHHQPQNPNPTMPRPRVHSHPTNPQHMKEDARETDSQDPIAYHMLVSFHGYNELHIEHVMKKALDDLRNVIWPLWNDGIESDSVQGHTCIVKFRNAPWDLSGPNVRQAYQLIAAFFRLFQDKGYSFQTAVNISTPTPRLIFQVTQPDSRAQFFLAYFSQDGRRFTLIEPPNDLDISISARLRSAFPHKILSDNAVEEYTRAFEVRRKPNSNVPEVESSIFFVEVLKVLNFLGFQLDATLPLGRRGPLGIRYTRELLVFKGYPTV
ncbi:hypothetical protein BDZ97DRAFT_1648230 [Flammula alnicola]|nr:hypothetical protein BDZ97DRAFT_1648230 [Flammula alnicola]